MVGRGWAGGCGGLGVGGVSVVVDSTQSGDPGWRLVELHHLVTLIHMTRRRRSRSRRRRRRRRENIVLLIMIITIIREKAK